jgi:ABC-type phosphate transport system auxiliary subunit
MEIIIIIGIILLLMNNEGIQHFIKAAIINTKTGSSGPG